MTLDEARQHVLKHRTDAFGVPCPCCDQLVKVYRRRINGAMALVLLALAKQAIAKGSREWLHVPNFVRAIPFSANLSVKSGGDWSKLRFWGLIEMRSGVRDDGSKRNGWYRITQEGVDFALKKTTVPKYALITNQQFLGFDGSERASIDDALGKKFRYDELMVSV